MVVIEKNGAYHLKGYSSVSFKDGTLLRKLKANGTPIRVQQTCVLARKADEFPSASHWKVQELAIAKQRKIAEWEAQAETATAEPAAPSADMTVTTFFLTVFVPWLEGLVKTNQKSHATLVSYKRYWKTYLADHFNGTKTFKNYEPYIGAQFLQNLRRPEDDTPYGLNTIKHIHACASGIFGRATELGYCKHNPWRDVRVSNVATLTA